MTWRGFIRLLAAAAWVWGAAANAQDAAAPPPAAPVSILPDQAPADSAPQEPAIEVGDLAAPGIDRIGLVDTSAGGFTPQLWRGTELEMLKQILPQLPTRMVSPAQRHLAQNLLLSPGSPPAAQEGETMAADAAPPSQWLLERRLATLAAMGHWSDVSALLELVPGGDMSENLKRLRADADLVTNRINPACAAAQASLNASPDPHWQQIQVFCQLAIGDPSAATLGLALLREQKLDDPMFFWAADVIQGSQPPLPDAAALTPLHLAMLRKANMVPPATLLKNADPTALGVLGGLTPPEPVADKADKTPAAVRNERRRQAEEARILMAERAVAFGTLDAKAVRELYRKVNAKDPVPPPLSQIAAGDLRGRALLYQAALAQTIPTARAEVIALVIDLARNDRGEKGPDLIVTGKIYEPLLAEMEPAADLVWFAGAAARGLLAAGNKNKAEVWLALARDMGRTSGEAGQVADGLWPIDRLLNKGAVSLPQGLRGWAKVVPAETAAAKRATLLNLLAAVGDQVTSADWLPIMGEAPAVDAVPMPAPQLWNGVALAARDKHVGEAVALSLVALGDGGPAHVALPAVQHIIAALRAVGREDDARALAVEAALVQGL